MVEVRTLTAADHDRLTTLVGRARDAGELAGSSDPDGVFLIKISAHDPTLVALAWEDARAVGFVAPEFKVLSVEPAMRRRGIGRSLVETARRMEAGRGRADLILGPPPGDPVATAFLRATGFVPHSMLWDLGLDETVPLDPPDWPAGITVRTFDRTRDVDGLVDLFNAAFADHATPLSLDREVVRVGMSDPDAVDADLLLAFATDDEDGRPIGFCATEPVRIDGIVQPEAEIWTIGVQPAAQGQGLGRQLLRWGVTHLRQLGARTVMLSVNGRNEGALRLYERHGFRRRRTRERWARPVGPGGTP